MILWIDSNTFATGLLERVFKAREIPFYTIAAASEFAYLVKDLNATLLVIDARTAIGAGEAFRRQYEEVRDLPVILIDEVPGLEFIQNRLGTIARPFDPYKIPSLLKNFQQTQ